MSLAMLHDIVLRLFKSQELLLLCFVITSFKFRSWISNFLAWVIVLYDIYIYILLTGRICQMLRKFSEFSSTLAKTIKGYRWRFSLLPRKQILGQSQQYKHYKKVWNMFKINNEETRKSSLTLFCFLCC